MSKHTQGPWHQMGHAVGVKQGEICTCWAGESGFNAAANARLISAAPELLEALTYIEGLAMADDVRDVPNIAQIARAAIAKATGEK